MAIHASNSSCLLILVVENGRAREGMTVARAAVGFASLRRMRAKGRGCRLEVGREGNGRDDEDAEEGGAWPSREGEVGVVLGGPVRDDDERRECSSVQVKRVSDKLQRQTSDDGLTRIAREATKENRRVSAEGSLRIAVPLSSFRVDRVM